jgi:uncharacterized repeat protein (TIGR01451 family)
MRRFAVFAVGAAGVVALLAGAARSGAAGAEVCATSGPAICITVTGDPATVPPSEANDPHFVSYTVQVANGGTQSATHVTLDAALSPGLVLTSASPSSGSCSIGATPVCTLGKIAGGSSATVEFEAQVPETEGTVTATMTAGYDETTNDNPGPDPKQDHVSGSEDTLVKVTDGSAASSVPMGASVDLTTDPTGSGVATASDPLIGSAEITDSPIATTALIEEVSAPFTCPKKVVCRGGDWFHASIPGTFTNPPLHFPLRWDKTLIPSGLNSVKKFALLYTECLNGCPLQVITAKCSSATPKPSELPCLTGVAKLPDGDWVATLISNHNGHMR